MYRIDCIDYFVYRKSEYKNWKIMNDSCISINILIHIVINVILSRIPFHSFLIFLYYIILLLLYRSLSSQLWGHVCYNFGNICSTVRCYSFSTHFKYCTVFIFENPFLLIFFLFLELFTSNLQFNASYSNLEIWLATTNTISSDIMLPNKPNICNISPPRDLLTTY